MHVADACTGYPRQILKDVSEYVLGSAQSFKSVAEHIACIGSRMREQHTGPLVVVVHNIDGERLRSSHAQVLPAPRGTLKPTRITGHAVATRSAAGDPAHRLHRPRECTAVCVDCVDGTD